MCGIAGIIGTDGDASQLHNKIHAMCDAMVHRGPDDDGYFMEDTIALGMRRLSIIDLETGKQPIIDDSGVVIVFNGEIYNYKDIRAALEKQGAVFKTQSDTEVILKLYVSEGLDGFKKLNGMFAIALYDPRQSKVHLVRDRLGIKPLYYGLHKGTFYFASELKCILKVLDQKPDLNKQAVADFLSFRFVPAPQTMWEGFYKLLPGMRLEYDIATASLSFDEYWSLNFQSEDLESGRDYDSEFEYLFLSAVEKRILASDVPVGVLLSGGLDSSAVAAAIAELGHRNLNCYTVRFEEGGDYSEMEYARQVAQHFGLQHHDVEMKRDEFLQTFQNLPYQTDEPLADLASIPLYHICKRAKQDVTVLLSGEGADETLAGYNLEDTAAWLAKMKGISKIPAPLLKLVSGLLKKEGLLALADHGWSDVYKALKPHNTSVWSDAEKQRLFHSEYKPSQDVLEEWYAKTKSQHPLDQLMEVSSRQWLVEDLLMKADKMSMAASVELRVPFLDHTLVEWVQALPHEYKVGSAKQGWTTKKVLRDFAAKRLPDTIIKRPKQGFPVPCYQWLQEDGFYTKIKGDLSRGGNALIDMLDNDVMIHELDKAKGGDMKAAHKTWAVMVLNNWAEAWL